MKETIDSIWFATRVRLLAKRAQRTLSRSRQIKEREEVEALEKELNTCSATLEMLLDYAQQNKVTSHEDHEVMKETYQILEVTQHILEEQRLGWWEKLIRMISQLLPIIRDLLEIIAADLRIRKPMAGLLVSGISVVIGYLPASRSKEILG